MRSNKSTKNTQPKKSKKTIIKKIKEFTQKKNGHQWVGRIALLIMGLSIFTIAYLIDQSSQIHSTQLFIFVILSLFVFVQATSLWIFSKIKDLAPLKVVSLESTALIIVIVGLLLIFQTLDQTYQLGMTELFLLLIGAAVPLTAGKVVWDKAKKIEQKNNKEAK